MNYSLLLSDILFLSMKKLLCAVIGCGRIGCGFDDSSKSKIIMTHAGSYFKNSNTKLSALCDIDKNKLMKYGKKYNVKKLYNKSFDLFAKEDLDCISICTMADSHLELVNQAVKAGVKGIFLEKPISNTLKNTKKIIKLCKKNNVKLAIDYQRRYDPFYISIKNFINDSMGKIQIVNVYYGGGIANTGSHLFDLLRFFFGEIKSLRGFFSKNQSGNILDPNIDLQIEFRKKINCTLQSLDYRNFGLFEMDILSSEGRMSINLAANTHEIKYFKKSIKDASGYRKLLPFTLKVKKSKESTITLAVKDLVNCIISNNKPVCTGIDGYKSLELVIASIISSKQKKVIHLPISSNKYKISSK